MPFSVSGRGLARASLENVRIALKEASDPSSYQERGILLLNTASIQQGDEAITDCHLETLILGMFCTV